jgi:AcrR family transcriptional regulator
MGEQLGLRERKKQRTRELIADTAMRLFLDRGFDGVTVAEIAREAEVAQQTVFNYFPAKEDLVYWRMESFEQELLETVREREPGESVLAALGRFVREPRGALAEHDPDALEQLDAVTRMIGESRALQAREEQTFARYTASLAALIADETGAPSDDAEPWVAANAMIGVHRALVAYVRQQMLAGARNPRLARGVQAQAKRALASLERGFGSYAVKEAARVHGG